MKVCFIGFGSIAWRHIRNLRVLKGTDIEIDVLRSGQGRELTQEQIEKISQVYYSREKLPDFYDALFITNPTGLHYDTLKWAHSKARNFFIEKPVFKTGKEDISALKLHRSQICYVACPLRYTNVIQYLKKNVDFSSIYSVRCISSSYLPDWRPGIDYRDTYSAHKNMGGGVSIDLIHEWDYLIYLLGEPLRIQSLISRKSKLEIDSDDVALYMAEYSDKVLELHLDYFGRIPVRKLELLGENEVIEADLIHEQIIWKRSGTVLDFSEDRDNYQQRELQYFLKLISGECGNENSIEHACRVLRIARGE